MGLKLNRRELRRRSGGSRTQRRSGTKSQGIPGSQGNKSKFAHYRYPRRRKERPSVTLERLIRQRRSAE